MGKLLDKVACEGFEENTGLDICDDWENLGFENTIKATLLLKSQTKLQFIITSYEFFILNHKTSPIASTSYKPRILLERQSEAKKT